MASDQRTFCSVFQATAARDPSQVALQTPGGRVSITWAEYAARVERIARGLAGLGVRPGDTVGLMLTNRPEFHLVDTGALHAGATPFSIYNSSTAEQIAYLFGNAGNRVVICEAQFVDRVLAARGGTRVEHVVCVDAEPAGTTSLADLESTVVPGFDFEATWRAVTPEDVLTIIYTSGTTGPPKGVELTHASMLAEVDTMLSILPVDHTDRIVSYLPDAHVANRWGAHYTNLHTGNEITTVADIKGLIPVLPEVRPTFFGAVPQIWYKIKAAIEAALAAEPSALKRRVASSAIASGREVARLRSAGRPIPIALRVRHRVADRVVLSRLRHRLGLDQVKVAATGAAAIAPEALEFVLALGIPCREVWGMSEVSAVAIANRLDAFRIGTVGQVVPGTQIKLDTDGELLVRGPLLMRGYRNDPARTADTIDADGWLHTGDVARIDADGYVTLVDRKKELIINAAGKNMSPANIENTVTVTCALVSAVVAIGDDRPFVTALVTLDPDAAAAYAARNGLTDTSAAVLAADPGIRAEIELGIKAANEKLSRVEQIKRFAVLPTYWEPGGDELTPTLKLRRKPISAKYASEIDAMYTAEYTAEYTGDTSARGAV